MCNLHNTANKFLYIFAVLPSFLLFFLWLCFPFVDQLNEFLAFGACECVLGGGVVYVCFVLFVMWAFFMCILSPSVSVCGGVMFDWPGSCLLALVDVMAIKLVVSFSANKVLGVTRRCAGDVLINSLRALAA